MSENNENINNENSENINNENIENHENLSQNQIYPINNSTISIQSNNFPQQINQNLSPPNPQFMQNQIMNFQPVPMGYGMTQFQNMSQLIPVQSQNINFMHQDYQKLYNQMKTEYEQNNETIKNIRKELEERKKKRDLERKSRNLVLFFNYKGKILPISCKADDLIREPLVDYKMAVNKENINLKFKYKETELVINSSAKLLNEINIINGEEIIVED